ncbi:MAG: dephospho-CoA kinase, partial [Candidatus Omnitrophica bacterium]|nr:dephospho-CoA kinase [Candidatus Omnitrophota bacterium]
IKEIKDSLRVHRARKDKRLFVIDVPLLFESGLDKICDRVVVVRANMDVQIKRVQKKNRLTKAEILKRIKAQMPMEEKVKRADVVIDNQGNINQTKKQVEELCRELKKKKMWK